MGLRRGRRGSFQSESPSAPSGRQAGFLISDPIGRRSRETYPPQHQALQRKKEVESRQLFGCSQTHPPYQVTSSPHQLELLRAPATVLVDIDAALRVDGEAVGLVEFACVGSGAAKIAEDFAATTLHD